MKIQMPNLTQLKTAATTVLNQTKNIAQKPSVQQASVAAAGLVVGAAGGFVAGQAAKAPHQGQKVDTQQ